mmetsp:Transcript_10784/g.22058  ORF Transcript_10784/g.22058 Transcript_10784/m.22058 type:complete len:238 (+) Transcript_10784:438-1151(+)
MKGRSGRGQEAPCETCLLPNAVEAQQLPPEAEFRLRHWEVLTARTLRDRGLLMKWRQEVWMPCACKDDHRRICKSPRLRRCGQVGCRHSTLRRAWGQRADYPVAGFLKMVRSSKPKCKWEVSRECPYCNRESQRRMPVVHLWNLTTPSTTSRRSKGGLRRNQKRTKSFWKSCTLTKRNKGVLKKYWTKFRCCLRIILTCSRSLPTSFPMLSRRRQKRNSTPWRRSRKCANAMRPKKP